MQKLAFHQPLKHSLAAIEVVKDRIEWMQGHDGQDIGLEIERTCQDLSKIVALLYRSKKHYVRASPRHFKFRFPPVLYYWSELVSTRYGWRVFLFGIWCVLRWSCRDMFVMVANPFRKR